jgi:hypothetical protein
VPTAAGTPAAVGYGARCTFLENFDSTIYFENHDKINIKKFQSKPVDSILSHYECELSASIFFFLAANHAWFFKHYNVRYSFGAVSSYSTFCLNND